MLKWEETEHKGYETEWNGYRITVEVVVPTYYQITVWLPGQSYLRDYHHDLEVIKGRALPLLISHLEHLLDEARGCPAGVATLRPSDSRGLTPFQ
jgi:hypothetical protein